MNVQFQYHGNYCGPNWSAGKYQGSVIDPRVLPIDDFDYSCMEHDAAYARNYDLGKADFKFGVENLYRGTNHLMRDPVNLKNWKQLAAGIYMIGQSFTHPAQDYGLKVKSHAVSFPQSVMAPRRRMKRRRSSTIGTKPRKLRKGSGRKTTYTKSKFNKKRKRYNKRYRKRYRKRSYNKGPNLSFERYGFSRVNERRGFIDDKDCIYLGHGPAFREIMECYHKAITKKLFLMADIDIDSWSGSPPFNNANKFYLQVRYVLDQTSNGSYTTKTSPMLGAGKTFNNFAEELANITKFVFSNGADAGPWQQPRFQAFRLCTTNLDETSANIQTLAVLQAEDLVIDYDFASYMTLQNQTKGSDPAAVADVNDELTTNIYHVPLKGRRYITTSKSNGLVNKFQFGASNAQTFIADKDTGIYAKGAGAGVPDYYKKPPVPYMMGQCKSNPVIMASGSITIDKIRYKESMTLMRFWQTFGQAYWRSEFSLAPYDDCYVKFGLFHLFSLEKVIEVKDTPTVKVTVGFEVTSYFKAKVRSKKHVTVPIIDTGVL